MVFGIRKPETAGIASTIPQPKNPKINPSPFRFKASRVSGRSLEAPVCKETSFENKRLIEFLISQ
jgi:hypothetical protein